MVKREGKAVPAHTGDEVKVLRAVRDAGRKGLKVVVDQSKEKGSDYIPPASLNISQPLFVAALHDHETNGLISIARRMENEAGQKVKVSMSKKQRGQPQPPSQKVAVITLTQAGNLEVRHLDSWWMRWKNAIVFGVPGTVIGGIFVAAATGKIPWIKPDPLPQPQQQLPAQQPIPFQSAVKKPGHLKSEGEPFQPLPNGMTGGAFLNDGGQELTVHMIEFQRGEIVVFNERLLGDRPMKPVYFLPAEFDKTSDTYSRRVQETVKPDEELTMKLAIIDKSQPQGRTYRGTVVVHYGDKKTTAEAILTVLHTEATDKPLPPSPHDSHGPRKPLPFPNNGGKAQPVPFQDSKVEPPNHAPRLLASAKEHRPNSSGLTRVAFLNEGDREATVRRFEFRNATPVKYDYKKQLWSQRNHPAYFRIEGDRYDQDTRTFTFVMADWDTVKAGDEWVTTCAILTTARNWPEGTTLRGEFVLYYDDDRFATASDVILTVLKQEVRD